MQPLHGIRVIDLTRILSGPFCTMTLADLGAEVIKIEPPGGDDTRQWGPPFVSGESTYYLSTNHGKKSLVLDLKTDTGKQVLWAVIGALAALRAREETGLGDYIDVSLLETVVAWQTYHAQAYLVAGQVPRALGSAHPTIAPYQTFAASDGYFTLAVGNDALWNRLCNVLDTVGEEDHWYRDPSYAHNADRVGVREALAQRLG